MSENGKTLTFVGVALALYLASAMICSMRAPIVWNSPRCVNVAHAGTVLLSQHWRRMNERWMEDSCSLIDVRDRAPYNAVRGMVCEGEIE